MVHGRHDSAVPSPSFRVHLPSPRRVARPGESSLCHSPIAVLLRDAVFGIRAVLPEEVDLFLIEFGVARATVGMHFNNAPHPPEYSASARTPLRPLPCDKRVFQQGIGKHGKWLVCTSSCIVVYNRKAGEPSGRRTMAV